MFKQCATYKMVDLLKNKNRVHLILPDLKINKANVWAKTKQVALAILLIFFWKQPFEKGDKLVRLA